jgi:DnaA-like protein
MATELVLEGTDQAQHFLLPLQTFSPAPDEILDNLVDALRATLGHPELRGLAESTLDEVHRIQEAARRRLALQQRDMTAQRLDLLVYEIAYALHVDADRLRGRSRLQHIAFQRQIAIYLLRRVSCASFPQIAGAVGRDHSTAIHAFNLIARRVERDAAFKLYIARLESRLTAESNPPVRAAA